MVLSNSLKCLSDWSFAMQSKMVTDVIYFDIKRAFDSVSQSRLLRVDFSQKLILMVCQVLFLIGL